MERPKRRVSPALRLDIARQVGRPRADRFPRPTAWAAGGSDGSPARRTALDADTGLDDDRFLAAALRAADAAGEVIRPYFRQALEADSKSDESPVTLADRGAEEAIRAVLAEAFPDHGLIGEEFGSERGRARHRWVIDPIDGTRAFITGRPVFGTLIALLDGERPILGILDQPVTGERWIGRTGRPTCFSGPFGGRVGTRRRSALAEAELACTAPEIVADAQARWAGLAASVRRLTWGGDCYNYGLLSLGQVDVVAESGLKLWDWAALVPIVEGAGGRMRDWDGRPLDPSSEGRVLAVGDPALLAPAVAALRPTRG